MPLGMVCQADLQFAVDHEPGGRQHRYDLATVRHLVDWLRFRLRLWLGADRRSRNRSPHAPSRSMRTAARCSPTRPSGELLGHIHTVAWWLLFASDQITGDLAQAAYPAHFHPPSAVFWLTEDLIHIGDRLHQAIHPDNDNSDQPSGTNRRNPAAQAGTS